MCLPVPKSCSRARKLFTDGSAWVARSPIRRHPWNNTQRYVLRECSCRNCWIKLLPLAFDLIFGFLTLLQAPFRRWKIPNMLKILYYVMHTCGRFLSVSGLGLRRWLYCTNAIIATVSWWLQLLQAAGPLKVPSDEPSCNLRAYEICLQRGYFQKKPTKYWMCDLNGPGRWIDQDEKKPDCRIFRSFCHIAVVKIRREWTL